MRDTIFFSIYSRSDEQSRLVEPVVNDTPLLKLTSNFEREQNFDVAGSYGGLIPEWFDYGPLDLYFLGDHSADSYFAGRAGIYVLACQCGEVGCWPLECRVRIEGDTVVWERFRQPFRPKRDYSPFGPFVFDASQYRHAVAALSAEFPYKASGYRKDGRYFSYLR